MHQALEIRDGEILLVILGLCIFYSKDDPQLFMNLLSRFPFAHVPSVRNLRSDSSGACFLESVGDFAFAYDKYPNTEDFRSAKQKGYERVG